MYKAVCLISFYFYKRSIKHLFKLNMRSKMLHKKMILYKKTNNILVHYIKWC